MTARNDHPLFKPNEDAANGDVEPLPDNPNFEASGSEPGDFEQEGIPCMACGTLQARDGDCQCYV